MKNDFTKKMLQTFFNPLGEVLLHNKFPNEFELYLIALQVVDDDANLIKDFLVFPINPNSAMLVQKSLTNIKKTFNAVHINENNTFVPFPINLSGNFGRGFKAVLTGSKTVPIKTGYGITKYLSNLIKLSKGSNLNGRPYRTILYNLAFGDILTVEIIDCKFTQTISETRIWNYDLSLTAVAPGNIGNDALNFKLNALLTFNFVNKIMNQTVRII